MFRYSPINWHLIVRIVICTLLQDLESNLLLTSIKSSQILTKLGLVLSVADSWEYLKYFYSISRHYTQLSYWTLTMYCLRDIMKYSIMSQQTLSKETPTLFLTFYFLKLYIYSKNWLACVFNDRWTVLVTLYWLIN